MIKERSCILSDCDSVYASDKVSSYLGAAVWCCEVWQSAKFSIFILVRSFLKIVARLSIFCTWVLDGPIISFVCFLDHEIWDARHGLMYDARVCRCKITLRYRVADLSEFGVFRADKNSIFNRRLLRWRWTRCRYAILLRSATIWSRSCGLCQVISLQGRRLAPTSARDQGLQVAAIRIDKLSALHAF